MSHNFVSSFGKASHGEIGQRHCRLGEHGNDTYIVIDQESIMLQANFEIVANLNLRTSELFPFRREWADALCNSTSPRL